MKTMEKKKSARRLGGVRKEISKRAGTSRFIEVSC